NSMPLTLDGASFDHNRGDLDSPFCTGDFACDDGNLCTLDTCAPGGCSHQAEADCCLTDADCPVTDRCAITRCVENRCELLPLNLDDGDPCTLDGCDPATGPFHLPDARADADGDGIPDCRDRCPNTRAGSPVDPQLCPCEGP